MNRTNMKKLPELDAMTLDTLIAYCHTATESDRDLDLLIFNALTPNEFGFSYRWGLTAWSEAMQRNNPKTLAYLDCTPEEQYDLLDSAQLERGALLAEVPKYTASIDIARKLIRDCYPAANIILADSPKGSTVTITVKESITYFHQHPALALCCTLFQLLRAQRY